MAALFGVDYKLRWADFQSVATPPAGVPAMESLETRTQITVGGFFIDTVWQGATSFYMIRDTLVVRVFIRSDSWRLASLSTASGRDQVRLIKHEQGHYDITALLARDFYQRVRSLIGQPFTDPANASEQVQDHRDATIGRDDALNKLYDDDTKNSRDGVEQWSWWCAIERARQLHRSPPARDAEGRPLKVELVDALRSFGLVTDAELLAM